MPGPKEQCLESFCALVEEFTPRTDPLHLATAVPGTRKRSSLEPMVIIRSSRWVNIHSESLSTVNLWTTHAINRLITPYSFDDLANEAREDRSSSSGELNIIAIWACDRRLTWEFV